MVLFRIGPLRFSIPSAFLVRLAIVTKVRVLVLKGIARLSLAFSIAIIDYGPLPFVLFGPVRVPCTINTK